MALLPLCQLSLPTQETCLSPHVHKLIVEDTYSDDTDQHVLGHNGLLDFGYICSRLPEEGSQDDHVSYFQTCVSLLAPMFHTVEEFMENKNSSLVDQYKPFLDWTGQTDLLLELWSMIKSHDEIDDLTVLLVTTAVLERSLGNVYLIEGAEPCPSMLKDLLVSAALKTILGSHVIQVLRIMIGPPTSLNIRNVAWHGFPFPGEIPRRCIWFIMLLVPSIGQVLQSKNVKVLKFREPVSFPDTELISETKLFMNEEWPASVGQTKFVSWNTEHFWNKVKEFYTKQRYSYCAALLLFYLEQGLRQVFATVNKCENRILTAEATTLYTTFDEMLDHSMPDGSENKLCESISPQITEILLDHLQYQNGPRVRDRLSHSEACWRSFPWQLTDNLATIAVSLSLKFMPDDSPHKLFSGLVGKISSDISEYKVQFHRIALLKRNIKKCCLEATNIDSLVRYTPDLLERDFKLEYPLSSIHGEVSDVLQKASNELSANWSNNTDQQNIPKCLTYLTCSRFSSYMDDLLRNEINTLYRQMQSQMSDSSCTDRESEVLSVLEHITTECNTVLNNVQDFITLRQQQLVDKQLRSRQRENFKKFLNCFPTYVTVSNMCCYMCCWQLYHLDVIKHPECYPAKIRFWKRSLQFCENLRTCSQPEKNKWTDGLDLISQYTKPLKTSIVTQLISNRGFIT